MDDTVDVTPTPRVGAPLSTVALLLKVPIRSRTFCITSSNLGFLASRSSDNIDSVPKKQKLKKKTITSHLGFS